MRLTADDTAATVHDDVMIAVVEDPTCQGIINDGSLATSDISGTEGTPDGYVDLYDFAFFASE